VVRPRARRRACRSMVRRHYGSPAFAARGGGGRGEHGGAGGSLTGDGAAVKRPGDSGKMAAMKARSGDELQHKRGGKEGGVGCGEMRRDRGGFYRAGRQWQNGGDKDAQWGRAPAQERRKRGRCGVRRDEARPGCLL
jgi:hypothetical protein